MLENRANLLKRNTRKPLHELRDQSAVFEVLEQGCDRHAGSAEEPSSAHAFGIPLDGGTRGPIDHAVNGTTVLTRRLTLGIRRAGTMLAEKSHADRRRLHARVGRQRLEQPAFAGVDSFSSTITTCVGV
jgi:hypothetical protein